jgi:hypothetical protein
LRSGISRDRGLQPGSGCGTVPRMETMKVGDRVSKAWRDRGENHRAFGTIAYVKPDRVGVAWDARQSDRTPDNPCVFPALRSEIEVAARP